MVQWLGRASSESDMAVDKHIFGHIALQYRKPWRPTFLLVSPDLAPGENVGALHWFKHSSTCKATFGFVVAGRLLRKSWTLG